ncbi:MAG TPA: cellulase family glycosylhydrolase [Mycobacteriales bacterium]|nr:cellulase family glycosylhydrolase [Mycobacteriales bacterium]
MPGSGRGGSERYAVPVAVIVVLVVVVGLAAIIAGRNSSGSSPSVSTSTPPTLQPISSIAARQLLSGDASRFDGGVGGWSGAGATVSTSPSAYRGRHALGVTGNSGSAVAWSPRVKAVGGDRYVGSAEARAHGAAGQVGLRLRFLDGNGKVTDTEPGQQISDSLTAWTAAAQVAAIAPKGTTEVQLGVAVASGATQLVDNATLEQTPGGSTAIVGPLTTRGSQILDGNGRPVTLRGIGRFGLEGGTQTPLPTNAEIGQLKLWGANVVRVSLGEQKWLATSCHYESDYPHVVDQVVQWITSRGMVALLNLHFSQYGDCGTPGLTPMADSPGSVTFWQQVATRYKDNPLAAFDLFNEPNHVPESVWFDGGTVQVNGQQWQTAGMQQLYDTVRGTGAENLVVASGLDYASRPPHELLNGTDIVYGAHAYTCPNGPPPQCTNSSPYDARGPLHRWVGFAKHHPVLVTEFGFPDGDDGRYNASVVAYAEAHHWGWCAFAWDGGTDGLFDLVQAHPASDGTTIEPNSGGMPLVAGFARNTAR